VGCRASTGDEKQRHDQALAHTSDRSQTGCRNATPPHCTS
jgi:hypothetical protein